MKTFFLSSILAVCFFCSSLHATSLSLHCNEQGCFEAGVEYLYLKPTFHDPYFVIPERGPGNTNDPFGTRFANELDYQSGVRGYGAYTLFPCQRISVFMEGAYISDKHERSLRFGTTNPLALGTKGNPAADLDSVEIARSRLDYTFWNLKGGLHYCFCTPCPFQLAANINLHYADLNFKEHIFYDETNNLACVNLGNHDTYAIGPEFGIDFGYQIFRCLSFVTRGSYGLLVACHHATALTSDVTGANTDSLAFADNERHSTVIPVMELKLGLNYTGRFCNCFTTAFEVGFDLIRYTDILDRIRWIGDDEESRGLSLDYYSPFMLHGLYASASISF